MVYDGKRYLLSWFIISLILIVVTIACCSFVSYHQLHQWNVIEKNVKTLTDELACLEKDTVAKKKHAEQKEHYQQLVKKFIYYRDQQQQQFIRKLFEDIAQAISYDLFLNHVAVTSQRITLKGAVTTAQPAMLFFNHLQQLPYIYDGKIIHLKAQESDGAMLEFLIDLALQHQSESLYAKN